MFVLGAGVIAAAGIGNLLKGSIDEAREAQKVGAATEAIIKATGGAAGITAEQVGKMAGRLSAVTGIDDEAIQTGENLLLTFKNVKNFVDGQFTGTFDRATVSALDLSAAGFGSIESASKTMGKALNDPIKGVTALSRAGVTFSDQQKKQIERFVKTGQVAKAQNLILKEVESQVGGVAAATATSGDKAAVAMGNLKETIGTALLPVADRLANTFATKIAPAITTFVTGMQNGTGAGGTFVSILTGVGSALVTVGGFLLAYKAPIGAFVAVLATWAAITKVITTAQLLLNIALTANPIGLVVVAIALLVGGLVLAYQKSETFRAIVDATFGFIAKYVPKVIGAVVGFVKNHWKLLVVIIGGPIAAVVLLVIKHFDTIKSAVGTAIDFVVNSAKKFGTFAVAVGEHVGKAAKFFRDLPGKIKGFFSGLPGDLNRIGGQLIDGLVNGLKAAAHKVTDFVEDLIDKIPKKIRSLMGISSPSKVTQYLGRMIGQGLADGIASKGAEVDKKTKELVKKLRDNLSGLKSDFASLVEPIASAFTGNLFEAETGAGFVANLLGTKGQLEGLKAAFTKLLGWGLSPGFLSQLFASGNGGLILDLAAGTKDQATQAGSLFGDVGTLSQELGASVAGSTQQGADLIKGIGRLENKLEQLIKQGEKNPGRIGAEINGAARGGRRLARV